MKRFRQRGASLPETAIVLGVVLAMLFGIIDFGRAMYTYAFVAQLAREGARWMIVRGSQCSVLDHCGAGQSALQTYVQGLSEGMTKASSIAVNTPVYSGCATLTDDPGCTVGVTVSYPFNFLLPYLPVGTITMSSTSKMVISQ
ncbi:MAG TPA: TadE/TadG family type IV pilus assembly protein [Candidatus Cybelea sp.]|jgi:Flp pilus assembly protein TadG|nr:TadE/TadG family type IV pilus assembly protein [Candidatus Cybelea sp.]